MPLFFYKLGYFFCKHFPVQCFLSFCLHSKGNENTCMTCLYGLAAFAIVLQYLCPTIEAKYFVHKGIIHLMLNILICTGVSFQGVGLIVPCKRNEGWEEYCLYGALPQTYVRVCGPGIPLENGHDHPLMSCWLRLMLPNFCPERTAPRCIIYTSTSQRCPMHCSDISGDWLVLPLMTRDILWHGI